MFSLDHCGTYLVDKILSAFTKHHYDVTVTNGKDYGIYFVENLLSKLDPTPKKKYHHWLMSVMVKNLNVPPLSLFSDIEDWRNTLYEFDCVKKFLPQYLRDIGRYKNLEDLKAYLQNARLNGGRASKSLLNSMSLDSAMEESKVHYEGQDIIIFKPRSIEQAMVLGEGTKWKFDDRDGGLYRSLRNDGVLLIWFTAAGRFLSVIPYEKTSANYLLDEECEMVSFYDISSAGYSLEDSDKDLVTAVINAEAGAPFYLDWSPESKIKAVTLFPEILEKSEVRDFVEEMAIDGDPAEAMWAKAVLEMHDSHVESFQVADYVI